MISSNGAMVVIRLRMLVAAGYTMGEVVGRNARFMQGPDSDPEAVAELRDAVRTGRATVVELINLRKDGSRFWNQARPLPRFCPGYVQHFHGVPCQRFPAPSGIATCLPVLACKWDNVACYLAFLGPPRDLHRAAYHLQARGTMTACFFCWSSKWPSTAALRGALNSMAFWGTLVQHVL